VNVATVHNYHEQNRGYDRGNSYDMLILKTRLLTRSKKKEKNEKVGKLAKLIKIYVTAVETKSRWSCTCRTPKHLVDLYERSLKRKIFRLILFMNIVTSIIIWILLI
jgi:hypothetical protein